MDVRAAWVGMSKGLHIFLVQIYGDGNPRKSVGK